MKATHVKYESEESMGSQNDHKKTKRNTTRNNETVKIYEVEAYELIPRNIG